jgi:hypothetical protein
MMQPIFTFSYFCELSIRRINTSIPSSALLVTRSGSGPRIVYSLKKSAHNRQRQLKELYCIDIHSSNIADFILDLRNCYLQSRLYMGFTH